MIRCFVLYAIIVLCILSLLNGGSVDVGSSDSPFAQKFPNCAEPYKRIVKQTKAKAILCPMIK